MTTAITYIHTRARTTEYCYDVEVNGVLVAAANRYHDAELVAEEVERRAPSVIIAGIDALDAALDTITVEGMELHAPAVRCQEPDDLCSVDNPCPAHAADAAAYLASEGPACPCGRGPAIFFVQYPHTSYGYCCDCYSDQKHPPLLAQCAAIIRRCLGRTTGAESIIDELRRVDQALAKEGW